MRAPATIAIVGAGSGGAVLALALAQRGIASQVVDHSLTPPPGMRVEILQPNGMDALSRLGLLERLPPSSVRDIAAFDFFRIGRGRVLTVDYSVLPPPHNRALMFDPEALNRVALSDLSEALPGAVKYGVRFKSIVRDGRQVVGVDFATEGGDYGLDTTLVVGADGARSAVRQSLGIRTQLHHYHDHYLVTLVDWPPAGDRARYFVGRGVILGVFPAPRQRLYIVYMVRGCRIAELKQRGLDALKREWTAIDPTLDDALGGLASWDQIACLAPTRVRASSWVANGAALLGDAAHAMNPHVAQGRMQAICDALALADVVESCAASNNWSAKALSEYERRRRGQVEMLQRLGDELVFFWNSANPVVTWMRDRVFLNLERSERLKQQIASTTAGVRTIPPFSLADRFIAAGLWPE